LDTAWCKEDPTLPIDLATIEEIVEDKAQEHQQRMMAKQIEAAWFAQGDKMEEEEERVPEGCQSQVNHNDTARGRKDDRSAPGPKGQISSHQYFEMLREPESSPLRSIDRRYGQWSFLFFLSNKLIGF
jgi:hypothetical protein